MDLNRIHYFFKAVEYKNFTQAANACHIGQTTMSKYIAVLEQELQTQLFIREHRTLTLTKQGKQFYEGMKNIYASYQTFMSKYSTNEYFTYRHENNRFYRL